MLSERTRGLIGASELARLGSDAYLVNTSRGPIVDEAALVDALRNGTIAGAGLDVFDVEPLPAGHPLIAVFYADAIENILGFLDGAPVRVIE